MEQPTSFLSLPYTLRLPCLDVARNPLDDFNDLTESFVAIRKFGNRLSTGRQGLQCCKGCVFPFARSQDDGYHCGFAILVALQSSLHFNIVSIIGLKEVLADEEEDDIGGFEIFIDLAAPRGSTVDIPIRMMYEQTLTSRELELSVQLITQPGVSMGIDAELFNRCHSHHLMRIYVAVLKVIRSPGSAASVHFVPFFLAEPKLPSERPGGWLS